MKRSRAFIYSSLLLFICSLSSCSNNISSKYSPSSNVVSSSEVFSSSLLSTSEEGEYFYITFDAQGGNMEVKEYKLKAGEKLILPTDPYKEGYTFIGWFYEKECINKFDINKEITSSITLYAGYEKEIDYIEINSLNEFLNIENDKNYILMCDLDFNNEEIISIGNRENPYTGIFDGNGYTVSNYRVKIDNYIGLFGYVTGEIKNLSTNVSANINATTTIYFGSIAGYLFNGKIENCHARGTISISGNMELLSSYCAGILGRNEIGSVSKCSSTVSITNSNIGTTYTGSIVGYNGGGNYLDAKIIDCYAHDGIISSTSTSDTGSSYTGGVVGFNFGTVDRCFSANMIIRAKTTNYHCFAAGVVADNNGGIVSNSFSTSTVEVITDSGNTFRGGVIGRNFRSSFESDSGTMYNCYSYDGQKVRFSVSDNDSLLTARHHQVVTKQVSLEELQTASWYKEVLGFSSDYLIKNNYYPSFNTNFKKVNLTKELGTKANPIEIKEANDLLNIDNTKSYKLMNDISLDGINIKQIGTYKEPYFGTFDGNGFEITNITINSDTNSGYNSLFGYVNGSIINLKTKYKIDNYTSTSKMPQYFGGIAAFVVKSYINNCSSEVDIYASFNGGIIGGLIGYNEESIIVNCCSHGFINSNMKTPGAYTGGLIGVNENGILKYSSSNIEIVAYGENNVTVGGLIAKNDGVISSCYSISKINVESPNNINAGGFIGYNIRGSISDSYTISNVLIENESKLSLVGGFGGLNEATVSNCYYLCDNEDYFSFGHSIVLIDINRINEDDLKTLADKLSPYFEYSEEKGYLVLKGGNNNE